MANPLAGLVSGTQFTCYLQQEMELAGATLPASTET